ncbi:polyprenol phosphomannose-dependent alpha 1,6 mannosyltransferase MptB [Granulicoccus phenolivorans]|uniref:polyprenol phosphomannose-dependent alpha 1,6 mannosyltransferase MptB n=1 Tax=Granulicoccus phenolivorans TaxID=266854 RepID=UPI0004151323|nr:polyprenol phosphomannose-dependent alpha 1,6 mannosyltransferase MptB [Granulicoccus phenolivorans]
MTAQTRPAAGGRFGWLRTRGVLMGLLGSICISIAVMTPGFVPNAGLDRILPVRWFRNLVLGDLYLGRVFMLAGLILLIGGWLRLRPAVTPRVPHAAILALWSLPMLLAPPIFSSDVFLYADQGWILHLGLDPYQIGLAQVGGPFDTNVHWVWRGTTAIYPPLALQIQHLIVSTTGYSGYLSVVAMRIPAIIAAIVIAVLVPRLARLLRVDPELAKWMAVLNPMLLLHYIGGAHNDALMAAGVLLACYLTYRFGRPGMLIGAAIIGVGTAIKQPGLMAAFAIGLIPVAHRLPSMPVARRLLVGGGHVLASIAVAGLAFVATTAATGLGFGWIRATSIGELTWSMSPSSVVEQIVGPIAGQFGYTGNLLPLFSQITTGLSVLALVWLAWRYFFADRIGHDPIGTRWRLDPAAPTDWHDYPLRWLAWAFILFSLGGSGYHTWYWLWGGIYLGMLRYNDKLMRLVVAIMIFLLTTEAGQEYYSVRTIPGMVLGATLAYLWWIYSVRWKFNRSDPTAATDAPVPSVSGGIR